MLSRIVAGACLSSCMALAARAEEPLHIGPLRFGMLIDEAASEMPQTAWRVLRKSEFTGTVTAIRASETFELAGMPFLVEIYAPKLGEYKLRYVRQWSAQDARECSAAAGHLISVLESQTGRFAPKAKIGVKKVGASSAMSVDAQAYGHAPFVGKGDPAHLYVESSARIERERPVELEVRAEYERLNQGRCGLALTATRAPEPRAPERYPFSQQRVTGTASVSSRNRDLRRLHFLPAEGLSMTFNCKVRRADGNVDFCKPEREEDKKNEKVFHAALWQAMAITLNVEGYDPDDPMDLDVQIPIKLVPSDQRRPNFGSACRLEEANVPWNHRPKQFDGDYPDSARKKGLAAVIEVACEIQSDGSLICGLTPGEAAPPDPDLLERALLIVERGDVARENGGQPTEGCLLSHRVIFPKPRTQ